MSCQFGPGQLFALTVLRHSHNGHGIVATAQQVFGKVQGGAGKPLCAGHLRTFEQHRVRLLMKAQIEEVDDGLPEVLALIDGPLMQGRVVIDVQMMPLIDEAPEGFHAGLADSLGAGLPQNF
ncbi:hypothetical protein D3C84_691420 [compost metagenome]